MLNRESIREIVIIVIAPGVIALAAAAWSLASTGIQILLHRAWCRRGVRSSRGLPARLVNA